jgi:hypothetical protein
MIACEFSGLGQWAATAWSLIAIGYGIGLALHRLPLPGGHGSSWGGHLISYALVSAGFIAILGTANALNGIVGMVSSAISATRYECSSLPDIYMGLGSTAFTLLAAITGIGMGAALIPIVGPAIANVFSVVASLPGLALSVTLITGFTLMVFLTVFGSLAVVLAPVGVALLAVPGGKLKGIGGWLLAAALAFTAAGPYIPTMGLIACSAGTNETCDLAKMINPAIGFSNVFDLIGWLFNPQNNTIMQMWRFALGSLAGWGIVMAAAAALSKGIGGVAASLGFG